MFRIHFSYYVDKKILMAGVYINNTFVPQSELDSMVSVGNPGYDGGFNTGWLDSQPLGPVAPPSTTDYVPGSNDTQSMLEKAVKGYLATLGTEYVLINWLDLPGKVISPGDSATVQAMKTAGVYLAMSKIPQAVAGMWV